MVSSSAAQSTGFVTSEQFMAMSDKWAGQFACMEALLSRGNIFSTPVSNVKPVDSQYLISETPFLPPATHPTGPVQVPEASVNPTPVSKTVESEDSHKDKKKAHKSRKSDLSTEKDTKPDKKTDKKCESKSHKKNVTGSQIFYKAGTFWFPTRCHQLRSRVC